LPSDVVLSVEARAFLDGLPPDYRALWDELIWRFVEEPMTPGTIPFALPQAPVGYAGLIGPFVVFFQLVNEGSVVDILAIGWGPHRPYLPAAFYRP
jgi:hypothetical protein